MKRPTDKWLIILIIALILLASACQKTPNGDIAIVNGHLDLDTAGISVKTVNSVKIREAGSTKEITDPETIQKILDELASLTFSEYTVPTNEDGWSTEAPGSRHLSVTLIGKGFESKISFELHEIKGKLYFCHEGAFLFSKYMN